jgi:hypothetical protein
MRKSSKHVYDKNICPAATRSVIIKYTWIHMQRGHVINEKENGVGKQKPSIVT